MENLLQVLENAGFDDASRKARPEKQRAFDEMLQNAGVSSVQTVPPSVEAIRTPAPAPVFGKVSQVSGANTNLGQIVPFTNPSTGQQVMLKMSRDGVLLMTDSGSVMFGNSWSVAKDIAAKQSQGVDAAQIGQLDPSLTMNVMSAARALGLLRA